MRTIPKAPAGHFNVLYFAAASSFTSKEYESLPAPLPLGKLFSVLEERYPGFQAKVLGSCLVTVNMSYVDMPSPSSGDQATADDSSKAGESNDEESTIKEGDEVAIIPPVSAG